MTAKFFVDTNILIYATSNAIEDAAKRVRALEVIRLGDLGFSTQVMQEYYTTACRKKILGITPEEAMEVLKRMLPMPIAVTTPERVIQAIAIRDRYQISYWDAAIIAAAQELSCEILYSEDLNDSQEYGGVRVVNPFAELS